MFLKTIQLLKCQLYLTILDEIKAEVLANEIVFDKIEGYSKEWNIRR